MLLMLCHYIVLQIFIQKSELKFTLINISFMGFVTIVLLKH